MFVLLPVIKTEVGATNCTGGLYCNCKRVCSGIENLGGHRLPNWKTLLKGSLSIYQKLNQRWARLTILEDLIVREFV